MDTALQKRLDDLEDHNKTLQAEEEFCGELEANEKSLFASLFLKQTDPKMNLDTKKSHVYASKEWRDFAKGLAIQQSIRNMARRHHEILTKTFDAEYLSFKVENSTINRQK